MLATVIILALLTLLVATEPDPHDACPPIVSLDRLLQVYRLTRPPPACYSLGQTNQPA